MSRAYDAVFHAAPALLFSVGLEARSHKGIASLVGAHFVHPGRLPSTMGQLVSRMQRDCEDADYATGAVFTQEEASTTVADAEAFLEQIRRIIHA